MLCPVCQLREIQPGMGCCEDFACWEKTYCHEPEDVTFEPIYPAVDQLSCPPSAVPLHLAHP